VCGKLIGKVIENVGLVRNNNEIHDQEITVKSFGDYEFVRVAGQKLLDFLLKAFENQNDAFRIYCIGIINLIQGYTHIKNYKKYYETSILSNKYKDLYLSKNTSAEFLEDLGSKTQSVDKLFDLLQNDSSHKFAIDGHCVKNFSKNNNMAKYGNKYKNFEATQINYMVMLDLETRYPVMSHFFCGSELDKTSIKEFLSMRKIENSLFVLDAGFSSKENFELYSENGNKYIIPLTENLKEYKEAVNDLKLNDEFNFRTGDDKKVIEFKTIKNEGYSLHVCRDITEGAKIRYEYSENLRKGAPNHTKEKFEEIKKTAGIIVLRTTLDENAESIFTQYKKRWGVETFFDAVKNDFDYIAIGLQSYNQIQAMGTICLVSGWL
jgi:transposase